MLKQTLLRMSGSVLLADFLPERVRLGTSASMPAQNSRPCPAGFRRRSTGTTSSHSRIVAGTENLYAEALERMEREVLVRVLRHTGGNQLQAARILGITRGSLRNEIRALGINIDRSIWSDDDQGDS